MLDPELVYLWEISHQSGKSKADDQLQVTLARNRLVVSGGRSYLESSTALRINKQKSIMIQNYYPLDFEAQYEQTSEKMIQISKKHKDIILNQLPQPIPTIENELEDLLNAIEEADLQFKKQSIYSQFASGQLMAQRRKQPPEMCPQCGDELKKQVQCEFCAELFCKKCCNRSRVIPFVSKQSRLCCEQCHWKFVKLFDNAQFYEEKEKLVNVMNFVRNKANKIGEKVTAKKKQVQEIKNERRNDKIKQKIIEKKIQDQQKKLKELQQELRQAVLLKAEKIREAEKRQKEIEEEAERQRIIAEQEESNRQQQLRIREQEQQERAQRQKIRQKKVELQKQKQTKEVDQERIRKEEQQRLQAQIRKKYEEQMRKKNQELEQLKRLVLEQSSSKKSARKLSESSSKSGSKRGAQNETPKQIAPKNNNLNQKLVNTEATSQSNRSNKQQSVKSVRQSEDGFVQERVGSIRESTGSSKLDSSVPPPPMVHKMKSQEKREDLSYSYKVAPEQKRQAEPEDALERSLANMLKLKKDDDIKSVSNVSRTSKNFMDMSVNDLLAIRLPPPSSKTKMQIPEEPERDQMSSNEILVGTTGFSGYYQEPRSPLSPLSPQRNSVDRSSLKLVQNINEASLSEEQVEQHRRELIKNSSLLSSAQRKSTEGEGDQPEARKCQCQIM